MTLTQRPTVFEGRAIFRQAKLGATSFADVEFRDHADFNGVRFTSILRLDRATFEKEVDFHGASFAAPVYLGETRFQQGAWLAWEQIAGRVAPAKADTFAMLEENFTKLGDLRSQNEAHYWSEIYRGRELAGWSLLENQLWGALTGYGVKPLRVLAILALTAAVFLCLQLSPLFWRAVRRALPWGRGRVDGAAGSATEVGGASWRTEASLVLKDSAKTIFQLNPKDAQGRATIYVVEYAVMKLLLLLLAVTVANVSPVLRVFTRLLPV